MAKPKVKKPVRPNRDPDHYSKRDVPYWWSPDWVRGTSADVMVDSEDNAHPNDILLTDGRIVSPCPGYGKIHAVKKGKSVELNMLSKDGKLSFIQGSIQQEFIRWHEDRQIDYMLLGEDPDELLKDLSLEETDAT